MCVHTGEIVSQSQAKRSTSQAELPTSASYASLQRALYAGMAASALRVLRAAQQPGQEQGQEEAPECWMHSKLGLGVTELVAQVCIYLCLSEAVSD